MRALPGGAPTPSAPARRPAPFGPRRALLRALGIAPLSAALGADAQLDRLPSIAPALVEARPDAIVPLGVTATGAAKQATSSVPSVFYGNFDPVATGIVGNLARPGGNVTGIVIAPVGTLAANKVELLLEAAPGATRIAFLAPPDPGSSCRDRCSYARTR